MGLSQDLVNEFVKATKDDVKPKKETTVFGTTVEQDGKMFVQLDGAEMLTPVMATADTIPGERVTVMIKNHTATITGNMSSPSARIDDVQVEAQKITAETARIDKIIAENVKINNLLTADSARIDVLESENVEIKDTLTANSADIDTLQAREVDISGRLTATEADIERLDANKLDANNAKMTYATIENLNATNATIDDLTGTTGEFKDLATQKFAAIEAEIEKLEAGEITVEQLKATFATIAALDVEKGRINDLQAELGDINTLIFGSASGTSIQTSFANAVIAQLGDAQIKSAMIDSVTASKITSGDIITDNVNVKSADGKLLISDQTIQISDNARVRVQIGKDSSNDYSINIWDADGNLMFSEGGITDNAIKDAIIRNDMVSDDANIAAHKLDIDSLFDEINENGSKTIKSTKVYLDDKGQTLDVAFEAMTTDVTELESSVSSHTTQIQAIQGDISSKIWQQDIKTATDEIGNTTSALSTQYSTLQQTVNTMSSTIESHTTQINKKADQSTVTEVSNKVNSVESDLDGYKSTVSNTYATKDEVTDVSGEVTTVNTRVTSLTTEVNRNATDISAVATRTTSNESAIAELELTADGLTARLDKQSIGGTNILRGTNQEQALGTSSSWANGTWRVAGSGTGDRMSISVTDAPNPAIKWGFQISGDGSTGDSSVAQNSIPVVEGKEYTVSCYAKGTGQLKFQVGVNTYSTIRYTLSQVTNWTRYSFTFVAGDGNNLSSGKLNVYLANNGTGHMQICGPKLEVGNIATDWTPATTEINEGIEDASKTATNYMNFSSDGLVVGDMTSDELGNNVRIDSDSVDIRKGNDVLATFGANLVEIGKKSTESTLSLCGGAGVFNVESHEHTNKLDVLRTDAYSYKVYNHDMFFYSGYDYQNPVINGLSSCGKFRMYSYDDTNNTDIHVISEAVDAETQHRAGITLTSKLDGDTTEEYALVWAERHDGTSWTDNQIKVLPDRTEIDKSIRFTSNNQAIYGKHYDGSFVNAFQPCNTSGNTVIGWGMYNEEKGSTNIYGKDVTIGSSLAGKATFRPYYRKGDTITFDSIYTAGYVTSSMKNVQFFIPLSKPIIGSPTVSITSTDGFIIRQGGKYTHGSSSDTYVAPDSYQALYVRPGGIAVTAVFSTTTNALNNEPCGIAWKGSITLS